MPTVSAHVAATLAAHIDHVFGVMGNGNVWFLDALERHADVHLTPVRHEAGAVVAADAYHRASGGIAAATATYGAGFTNTLTALAEAVQAHSPLVLVVGDEPTSGPRPWDVDQIALASAVGARTYTVGRADAGATTIIAIEHALRYRVPAVLAIPYDVATLEAGPIPPAPELRHPAPLAPASAFAAATVRRLARALADAERPFLLAGRGAWESGAGAALGALADATGALTASTALGRGIFPRGEFDLGVTGGFGADRAMALVAEADVAVVFGAGLNQFTMRFGDFSRPRPASRRSTSRRPRRIRMSAGSSAATPARQRRGARDRARGAQRDAQRLAGAGRCRAAAHVRGGRGVRRRRAPRPAVGRQAHRRAAAGRPRRRLGRRSLHRLGEHVLAGGLARPHDDDRHRVPVDRPRLPSVPGAAAAKPESVVVLTTGDGGGLMALADLESAVRVAGGRGLAVVWNDGAYGAEVNLYGLKGVVEAPMLIPTVDFAGLADAVGAEGVVVRELADLDRLRSWAAEDAASRPFLLLDCRISTSVIAPYQQEIIRVNS